MSTGATNTGGSSWGSYVSPGMIQSSMDITKSIMGLIKAGKNPSTSTTTTPQNQPNQSYLNALLGAQQKSSSSNQSTDDTMKYMLIGGGVLVFIVLIFILKRK